MDGLEHDRQLIRDLVEFTRLKPAAVAKKAGLAVTTINRHFAGTATTRLSQPTLDKLRMHFPHFPSWQRGVVDAPVRLGDMRKAYDPRAEQLSDEVEIDQIDIRYGLGATYLDGPIMAEKRKFSRAWLRQFTKASPDQLAWAEGDGDSMEPTIRAGEPFLIDLSNRSPRMGDGIWVVTNGDVGMVKRMHFPGRGRIELLSDNKLVPTITVAEEEIHVIGRVVAVVRRL